MFVLTDGSTTVLQYPYTVQQLRADNPNTSFPSDFTNFDYAAWNMFPVTEVAQPAPSDPDLVVEEGTPVFIDPDWTQNWTERLPNGVELNNAKGTKKNLIRELFASKVDAAALAAGFSGDNLTLIENTTNFASTVLTMIFANSNATFRTNVGLCRDNAQTLIAAADAATTLSEIDAVDETSGWPV